MIALAYAYGVDICYMAIPKKYHLVNARLIWLTVSGTFFLMATPFIQLKPIDQQPSWVGWCAAALIFIPRAVAYIGLDLSYRSFAEEHPIRISSFATPLAWIASFFEIAALAGLYYFVNVSHALPDQWDNHPTIVAGAVYVVGTGCFLSFAFLLLMNSHRNKALDLLRSERRHQTDAALAKKRKATRKNKTIDDAGAD